MTQTNRSPNCCSANVLPTCQLCRLFCLVSFLVSGVAVSWAQDILVEDFESSGFAPWTITGSAFGSGPATGPVSGQQAVAGFLGGALC